MYSSLIAHIAKFVTLTDTENELMCSFINHKTVKKKQHLLEEGASGNTQYFIVKGCCRMYIINQKGNEQTLQFGIENWWMADYLAFHNNGVSGFYIQALENAEIITIDKPALETLLSKIPKLEKYFRLVLQKSYGASQIRIKYLFTMSAEERYHNMNDRFPEFVQRVPQYMLASYLEFTPEFLSKIRAGKT